MVKPMLYRLSKLFSSFKKDHPKEDSGVHDATRQVWNFSNEDFFAGMTNQEIFDYIYLNGIWNTEDTNLSSGPGSRDEGGANAYADAVKSFFGANCKELRAADVGCGDFQVGSKLFSSFKSYLGLDVSDVIISRNKSVFGFANVRFQNFDLTRDSLPDADVLFVRQVFQHLSNEDISKFILRVNDSGGVKWLIVTEHLPDFEYVPNLDKRTGAGVRTDKESGVDVSEDPFLLKFIEKKELLRVSAPVNGFAASIVTIAYRLH